MQAISENYNWIYTAPSRELISINEDGSEFLAIGVVEAGLTRLDSHWGTERFRFQLLVGKSGMMWADGSLEVVTTYGGKTRRLIGAATMIVPADTDFDNPAVNTNFSATIKSECIKNASKAIGLAFGAALNDRMTITPTQQKTGSNGKRKPSAVELPPDESLQSKYNKATEEANQVVMAAIRAVYPKIVYTGTKKIF